MSKTFNEKDLFVIGFFIDNDTTTNDILLNNKEATMIDF